MANGASVHRARILDEQRMGVEYEASATSYYYADTKYAYLLYKYCAWTIGQMVCANYVHITKSHHWRGQTHRSTSIEASGYTYYALRMPKTESSVVRTSPGGRWKMMCQHRYADENQSEESVVFRVR